MSLAELVAEGGFTSDDAVRATLTAFATLVQMWNARMDLTAARGDRELVDLLFADAAELARRLPAGASVIDVGSGGGAPGLPLGLLRPDLKLVLVEPLQKRVAFLRTATGTLRRTDLTVTRGRGEDAVGPEPRFDVAISRATLPPPEWLALGRALAPTVAILLAKGEPPAADDVTLDARYAWPLTNAQRRLVICGRPV